VSNALTLRVDLDSAVPAYRQIVDGLRILLVEGNLAPGSELPSVRRMATDLGIHFNTVAEAYRTLAEEGWVELRHGRGATVVRRAAPAATAQRWTEFRHRLRVLVAEMQSQGASAAKLNTELRNLADELKS
jgi:DNA-binding transcriptional regulator YhcF (GntR family)